MEVLQAEDTEIVGGGFLLFAILGGMLLNLQTLTASVTGAIDGMRDGFAGKDFDNGSNPSY